MKNSVSNWLVTFGDLLTLLLCFFLYLVLLTPKAGSKINQSHSGTRIAKHSSDKTGYVKNIRRIDLAPDGLTLRRIREKRLKYEVLWFGERTYSAVLRFCQELETKQMLSLRSQIIGAGVNGRNLVIRVGGSACHPESNRIGQLELRAT